MLAVCFSPVKFFGIGFFTFYLFIGMKDEAASAFKIIGSDVFGRDGDKRFSEGECDIWMTLGLNAVPNGGRRILFCLMYFKPDYPVLTSSTEFPVVGKLTPK